MPSDGAQEQPPADAGPEDGIDDTLGGPRDADKLGDYLEKLFVFAGRRRAALAILTLVGIGLAIAIGIIGLRWRSDPDLGASVAEIERDDVEAFDPDGVGAGDARPVLDEGFVASLSTPLVVAAGDGPRLDRIVVEPDVAALPQPAGAVQAGLFTLGGRTHVAVWGPPDWLTEACILAGTVTADERPIDAVWHDTPTGACRAEAAGRQAEVACVGARLLVLELVVPAGEVALAAGDPAPAAGVRVELRVRRDGFELAAVVGQIALPEGFDPTDVPFARAERGDTLELTVPDGEAAPLECLVQ